MNLRSPLAKRKKLADKRGSSGLRQEVEVEVEGLPEPPMTQSVSLVVPVSEEQERGRVGGGDEGESEYGSEYDEASSIASEDDFLAAELDTD
jgi:hypothetical protein